MHATEPLQPDPESDRGTDQEADVGQAGGAVVRIADLLQAGGDGAEARHRVAAPRVTDQRVHRVPERQPGRHR